MPTPAAQAQLQQPWKKWIDKLDPKKITENGVVMDANNLSCDSHHGTVALTPRYDVDLTCDNESGGGSGRTPTSKLDLARDAVQETETEPQEHDDEIDVTALHHRAIDKMFGLNTDFVQAWPGSLIFCIHLEKISLGLIEYKYNVIWKVLGCEDTPSVEDRWELYFAVLSIISSLAPEETTINAICLQLARDKKFPTTSHGLPQLTELQFDEVRRVVFAVLCWISATLIPTLLRPDTQNSQVPQELTLPEDWVRNSKHALHQSDYKRPAAKIFRGFRENVINLHPIGTGSIPSGLAEDTLFESGITYISLYRIGNVKLKFVDTIIDHLHFDRKGRTLSLFRFPTFCAMSILCTKNLALIESMLLELVLSKTVYPGLHDSKAIHREVLLSYRLLFAQAPKSRALIKQYIYRYSRDTGKDIDPFLVALCTTPLSRLRHKMPVANDLFPDSTLSIDGEFEESDTYSAMDDFPVFGHRLQLLQRYNLRQQPSKVKDLWRDRRNPLQWYTFWMVLWVGGAAIIISLLQLAVSAAQLYYSIPQAA
ncbi:hypothetical protein NUW58_g1672 [Xylaria curta]|uniref:Uncharacterized protein n=1 Tax=Xylaria curta TaxID=42375 RepID=A0ACC1PKS1_9PEZI|nr:hypothetical protein NUW58_g1672 [Xylaria curta]